MSTKAADSLYVEYDTLPNDQPGTHDIVDILLGHSTWTENKVVTYDWYHFEVYVIHAVLDADFTIEPGHWAGVYNPSSPVTPVSFGPRTAFATGTLTRRCLTGSCPTIDVTISATAVGPPRTQTRTGPVRRCIR